MAVTIKKKAWTLDSLVSRLFSANSAHTELANKAQSCVAANYELAMTTNSFFVKDNEGIIISTADLKADAVALAMKGKLGLISMKDIKAKITKLVTESHTDLMKKVNDTLAPPDTLDQPQTDEQLTLSLKATGDWAMQYYTNLSDTPVPLKEATGLHQPVCGTSQSSVYHVIALNGSLVVAARISASTSSVSIRAETTAHPTSLEGKEIKKCLLAAGLDKKAQGHYSMHLEPKTTPLAIKSIGALLFAMQYKFTGVSTNVSAIIGAGK